MMVKIEKGHYIMKNITPSMSKNYNLYMFVLKQTHLSRPEALVKVGLLSDAADHTTTTTAVNTYSHWLKQWKDYYGWSKGSTGTQQAWHGMPTEMPTRLIMKQSSVPVTNTLETALKTELNALVDNAVQAILARITVKA
jgi:hypothetical protein